MVSTQNTFFATNPGYPSILAKAHLSPPDCVPTVLDRSSVNRSTTKPLQSASLVKLITKHADIQSRQVLHGLQYHGNTPKSVSDLLAMGANRNADVITEKQVDETAAFENDVTYYKVLLEARERHREALRNKLHALRTIRAKRSTMYRKRATAKRHSNSAAATKPRAESNTDPGSTAQMRAPGDAWPSPCGSPASTDIESDISSVLDDDTVSIEKPVIYAV